MKKQITTTRAKIERERRDAAGEAIDRATLLMMLVLRNEFEFDEGSLVDVLKFTERYSDFIDQRLIDLRDVQEILERATGMKFRGWA